MVAALVETIVDGEKLVIPGVAAYVNAFALVERPVGVPTTTSTEPAASPEGSSTSSWVVEAEITGAANPPIVTPVVPTVKPEPLMMIESPPARPAFVGETDEITGFTLEPERVMVPGVSSAPPPEDEITFKSTTPVLPSTAGTIASNLVADTL